MMTLADRILHTRRAGIACGLVLAACLPGCATDARKTLRSRSDELCDENVIRVRVVSSYLHNRDKPCAGMLDPNDIARIVALQEEDWDNLRAEDEEFYESLGFHDGTVMELCTESEIASVLTLVREGIRLGRPRTLVVFVVNEADLYLEYWQCKQLASFHVAWRFGDRFVVGQGTPDERSFESPILAEFLRARAKTRSLRSWKRSNPELDLW
jgi:hypothetical protein